MVMIDNECEVSQRFSTVRVLYRKIIIVNLEWERVVDIAIDFPTEAQDQTWFPGLLGAHLPRGEL